MLLALATLAVIVARPLTFPPLNSDVASLNLRGIENRGVKQVTQSHFSKGIDSSDSNKIVDTYDFSKIDDYITSVKKEFEGEIWTKTLSRYSPINPFCIINEKDAKLKMIEITNNVEGNRNLNHSFIGGRFY
jgi:hypothetical protein